MKLLLTCEHAGNLIPEKYKSLFQASKNVLKTHRGYDSGALDLFEHLKPLAFLNFYHLGSRLLIEVNRSLHHPTLFSEFTRSLSPETKENIIHQYYLPYRSEVEKAVSQMINDGEEVLHLSIHSFTPELNGKMRYADVGLLYDPSRAVEKKFCEAMKKELKVTDNDSSLRIRFNYPYRGNSDGFTTYLRKIFPENYLGIELEVNQKYAVNDKLNPALKRNIYSALEVIMKF